jgi:hypothetical protein
MLIIALKGRDPTSARLLLNYRFREAKCAVDYLRQGLATYEILYRIGTRFNVLYYSTNYFRCALYEKKWN